MSLCHILAILAIFQTFTLLLLLLLLYRNMILLLINNAPDHPRAPMAM
jgi:hypothetical protein